MWEERAVKNSVQANIERYSMPSAGIYDLVAGLFFRRRYRDIARTIAAETPAGSTILDVSCGPGQVLVQLAGIAPTLVTTGLDVDEGMIARARRKSSGLPGLEGDPGHPRFVVADVAAMPFPDASFDLVVSSYAVHHWPDRHAGLAEIMRVLRPGGRAVIWDIASPHETETAATERSAHAQFAAAHGGDGGQAAGGSDGRVAHPSLLGTLRMMLLFRRIPAERYDFVKPKV